MIRTITVCCSVSFFKESIKAGDQLKKLGFKVLLPKSVKIMKKNKDFDITHYKTWFTNKNDIYKKTQFVLDHFKKVKKGDAILVLNLEKKGIKGYIGGSTLMEMTVAFLNKKPIYIYNDIQDGFMLQEEILSLTPIFINKNLNLIK